MSIDSIPSDKQLDLSQPRAFVYKEGQEPKMVYLEDVDKFYAAGWSDSPGGKPKAAKRIKKKSDGA